MSCNISEWQNIKILLVSLGKLSRTLHQEQYGKSSLCYLDKDMPLTGYIIFVYVYIHVCAYVYRYGKNVCMHRQLKLIAKKIQMMSTEG